MLKKFILFSVILLLSFQNVHAMSAESAVVIDADSGKVLYEHNAYEKRGMASTTKVMTALVVLENCKLDDTVTVSYNAASTEGSSMYLKPNEKITVENLLYGLMLNSGNDAATALAEHTSENVENFAKLMNEKAKEIGMKNSSFSNPHGLDDENHYSTAYDMALLTMHAMKNETFKTIVSTKSKIAETDGDEKYKYLTNHNKLLSMYEWCKGVKTGFTKKCGRCLVSYSEKDGVKLITVTLNAPDDWNDHIELYETYFNIYKRYNIVNINDYVCSTNIKNSEETNLKLHCCKAINLTLTEEEYKNLKVEYDYPDTVKAPVYVNQKIGKINIKLNNKTIASSDIVAKYGVSENKETTYKDNLFFLFNNLLSNFFIHI